MRISHRLSGDSDVYYSDDIYVKPWTRCTTYYMGIMLGYIVFKTDGKIKIPKVSEFIRS